MKTPRVPVPLPPDVRTRVERLAAAERRSVASMLVVLVTDALAARGVGDGR